MRPRSASCSFCWWRLSCVFSVVAAGTGGVVRFVATVVVVAFILAAIVVLVVAAAVLILVAF